MRSIPAEFESFVVQFEGKNLFQYLDNTGKPTIYIGHLVRSGEVYLHTEADCQVYFLKDTALACTTVERLTDGEANDNEFMAMSDFTFNEGVGAFATSSLLKLFNKGDKQAAALEFLKWDKEHVDGQLVESAGLKRRRQAEMELFLKAV